ncbi:hypothetical protein KUTeg_010095 [Tegillarca granosa]|uniref:Chitin-binding type-2 domain-containing protein n=1 Tax=Tegillarca granosa TaxID=220873 RepID=A0ABQ9F8Q4_TEGGR|nr:hypothetical protein KUTeg_010095 [Tegillarca granosa]
MVVVIIVVIVVVVVGGRGGDYSGSSRQVPVDCSVLGTGHYEIGCKYYTDCINGITYHRECTKGYVYSNVTHGCVDESTVGKPCGLKRDCTSKPNRKYADHQTSCTSYYTCQNGIYYGHNYCNPGLVFDEAMQICNWPVNVPAPCGTKH